MDKKIIVIGLVLIAVIIVAGCMGGTPSGDIVASDDVDTTDSDSSEPQEKTCPASCEDNNMCTVDSCSDITNHECKHDPLPNCCGNSLCEGSEGENRDTCPEDCEETAKSCTRQEDCNDGDECTMDACTQEKCTNVPKAGDICYSGTEGDGFVGTKGAGIHVTEQYLKSIAGQRYAIGVVKNLDVVNYEDIEVTANAIKRPSSVSLAKETNGTLIDILAPGDGSPFYVYLGEGFVVDQVGVEVTDYKQTSDTPYQGLKLEITPVRIDIGGGGGYEYRLAIENTGTKTASGVKAYTITEYGGIQEYAPHGNTLASGNSFQVGDRFIWVDTLAEVYIQTSTIE